MASQPCAMMFLNSICLPQQSSHLSRDRVTNSLLRWGSSIYFLISPLKLKLFSSTRSLLSLTTLGIRTELHPYCVPSSTKQFLFIIFQNPRAPTISASTTMAVSWDQTEHFVSTSNQEIQPGGPTEYGEYWPLNQPWSFIQWANPVSKIPRDPLATVTMPKRMSPLSTLGRHIIGFSWNIN